jgi:nicotinamide mononucleotide adenylyltransferase
MNGFNDTEEYSIVGKTLVFLPGSFKPPHKGHWTMVTDNIDKADQIHIFISNTSETYIANRKLSLTNLKTVGKLYKFVKENGLDINQQIKDSFEFLTDKANEINFNLLKDKLNELLEVQFDDSISDDVVNEFRTSISNYLNELQENLFKSVRYTSDGRCIEPETAAEIFDLYIKDYGYSTEKVVVHICNNPSPITAAVGFANHQCKDCIIYVGSKTVDEESERGKAWEQTLKGFERNPSNKILVLPTSEKIQAARDIRANINNLTKDMFPEKISEQTFQKIKELLTGEIIESKFNQLYTSIVNGLLTEINYQIPRKKLIYYKEKSFLDLYKRFNK